jgi:hypothetical protein
VHPGGETERLSPSTLVWNSRPRMFGFPLCSFVSFVVRALVFPISAMSALSAIQLPYPRQSSHPIPIIPIWRRFLRCTLEVRQNVYPHPRSCGTAALGCSDSLCVPSFPLWLELLFSQSRRSRSMTAISAINYLPPSVIPSHSNHPNLAWTSEVHP